jgi:hypothetical protein
MNTHDTSSIKGVLAAGTMAQDVETLSAALQHAIEVVKM